MSKKKQQAPILPARFQLNEEALKNYAASVLEFPFDQAVRRFENGMEEIKGKKLRYEERPPWRSLNDVLLLLTPTLTHAFEKHWDSERRTSIRQMLVLDSDPARRPSIENLTVVIQAWLRQWVESKFPQEIKGAGADLYDELMDSLSQPEIDWQEASIYDLWQSPNSRAGLSYRAIPSLLCSLLNEQAAAVSGRTIQWRLAHDRNGFVVVSDPQHSQYTDEYGNPGEGTFAYKLEFRVQTQAGKDAPRWVHLYVRCQRYADKPIDKTNFGRRVSVLVGTDRPRLAGWYQDSTLVAISVQGKKDNRRWQKGVSRLLETMKARGLLDPNHLFDNPATHRQRDGDECFVVYAEGMKYVRGSGMKHGVKTGFDLAERSEVVAAVAAALAGVVTPGLPLEADQEVKKNKRPWAMRGFKELSSSTISHKKTLTTEAISRALGGKPIQITVCCKTSATREELTKGLREFFFLEEGNGWPDGIQVVQTELSNDLGEELDWDTAIDKAQQPKALRQKTMDWKRFLMPYCPKQGYHLALIEIDSSSHDRQSIKGAVRRACIELGIASQMITTVKPGEDISRADKGRVQNAIGDLLLRQTGALYGLPTELYKMAGLPEKLSERLTVTAVYRRDANRTTTRNGANYAMAVRLLPDGRVEARLVDCNRWQPYLEATLALGRAFLDKKGAYRYNNTLKAFAANVLRETNRATLVLLDAVSWRLGELLGQLRNDQMQQDCLDFTSIPNVNRVYEPLDLPGLRAIRIREAGTNGETPQYVATHDEQWQHVTDTQMITSVFGAGFEDVYSGTEFLHYLSIGQLPATVSQYQRNPPKDEDMAKTAFGGSVAFRHQTAIEFVPFFLQPDDDPLAWCRVAHYLRTSPAWSGGHTLRPLPMHLAHTAMDDMMCLLGYDDEDDE